MMALAADASSRARHRRREMQYDVFNPHRCLSAPAEEKQAPQPESSLGKEQHRSDAAQRDAIGGDFFEAPQPKQTEQEEILILKMFGASS